MSSSSQLTTGQYFERKAEALLRQHGLSTLERNYHSRHGEIDLIMSDQGTVVFVEVRYRTHQHFGSASASVTPAKQKKIILTAEYYLQQQHWTHSHHCRFDVVSIRPDPNNRKSKEEQLLLEWIKDAFSVNAY